ncbi:MAG: lipopolysaccharide biosynthesis protein [Candidatus Aminicenantaceae bacterium]
MLLLDTIQELSLRLKSTIRAQLDVESRRLFKNSSLVFIANVIFIGGVFAQSVLLGRSLGVELYGIFILIVYFVESINEFLNLNINLAMVKFVSEYKSAEEHGKVVAFVKGSLIFSVIFSFFSVCIVTFIVYFAYGIFIKKPGLEYYIIAYALGKSLSFFTNISTCLLRVYDKFKLYSGIRILMAFFEFSFVICAVFLFPRKLSMLFVAVICARLIGNAMCVGAVIWKLGAHFHSYLHVKPSILREQWKEIRNFVVSTSAQRTIKQLISRGDVLILGVLATPVQVGYYAIAKKLAYSICLIFDPMIISVYPQLALLVSKKRFNEITVMLKKISKIFSVPLILFITFAFFLNKWIVSIIYGSEYTMAGKAFFLLLITSCITLFFFWLGPILFSFGRVVFTLNVNVIALIVGAAIALLLAPSYGAVGVAFAMVIITVIIRVSFLYRAIGELKRGMNA